MEIFWYALKVMLLCLCGFLVAELVGTLTFTVYFTLSSHSADFGLLQKIDRTVGLIAIGIPAAIYLTYGKVILMILCGEILQRCGALYYVVAGAGVGYWLYLSWAGNLSHNTISESDFAFTLTLSGLLAGLAFWFVAVRLRGLIKKPAKAHVARPESGGLNL